MLEKKTEHIKERIMMKKEEEGEYKREETDSKVFWGGGIQILRKKRKERYTVRNWQKNLMNKSLMLFYSEKCLVHVQISHYELLQTYNIN